MERKRFDVPKRVIEEYNAFTDPHLPGFFSNKLKLLKKQYVLPSDPSANRQFRLPAITPYVKVYCREPSSVTLALERRKYKPLTSEDFLSKLATLKAELRSRVSAVS